MIEQEAKHIVHPYTDLCLDTDEAEPHKVFMNFCNNFSRTQHWSIQHVDEARVDEAWANRLKDL